MAYDLYQQHAERGDAIVAFAEEYGIDFDDPMLEAMFDEEVERRIDDEAERRAEEWHHLDPPEQRYYYDY